MNWSMLRSVIFATLCLATLGACSPEVELARYAPVAVGGSAAGGAGAGGGGTGGSSAEGGDAGAEAGGPRLLADSVADFGLTQGEYGWYYGSDSGDVADFKPLTRVSVITTFVPPIKDSWDCWASETTHWTQIFRLGGHPNGTETSPPSVALLERAVRRWVSSYAGEVLISGEAAKIDLIDSNGVKALIYVDGAEIFSQTIEGDDSAGVAYEVKATLKVGSNVDFVLDPLEGDDHHDLSRFTGTVRRAPSSGLP